MAFALTAPGRSRYRGRVAGYAQTYETRIAATPDDCFAVVTDFESYPSWSSPIRSCAVLERYPDGRAKRVAFDLDMTIKVIHYVLEYTYTPPREARWRLVEGDLSSVEGTYRFEPDGSGTRAECTQALELGFWIPGFIRSAFEKKALRDSVEEFRQAVEDRTAAT